MIRQFLTTQKSDEQFIRESLLSELRVDGRTLFDWRNMQLQLSRNEDSSSSEVCVDDTRVVASVTADIVSPFKDRPNEGVLQFSTKTSVRGIEIDDSDVEICRFLEKSIRENDSIDLESLCVVSGEKVWLIRCEVTVLDYSGGNITDCCLFATIGALKSFRKKEISILSSNFGLISNLRSTELQIHKLESRDPLPLALHHSPLSASFALFNDSQKGVRLVADPNLEEQRAMDGSIVFTLNAQGEVCGAVKGGRIAVLPDILLQALSEALSRTRALHTQLETSLLMLEERCKLDQTARLNSLRLKRLQHDDSSIQSTIPFESPQFTGINRNDPLLEWDMLHKTGIVSDSVPK